MLMQFVIGSTAFSISSPQTHDPQSISFIQMDKLLNQDHYFRASLFVMQVDSIGSTTDSTSQLTSPQDAALQAVSKDFQPIFQIPSGFIRPSSPITLVRKDGTRKLYIEYRSV